VQRRAQANGNGSQRPSSDALAAAARAMGVQRGDGGGQRMLDGLGRGGPVRMSSEPDDVDTQTPHNETEAEPAPHEQTDTSHDETVPAPHHENDPQLERLARAFSGGSDEGDGRPFDDGFSPADSEPPVFTLGDDGLLRAIRISADTPPTVRVGELHDVPVVVLRPYRPIEGDAGRPGADDVRNEYGIPLGNQRKFQDYATSHGLVLVVRPTNPASVQHLENGALPKPQDIKAKTINDLDVELGAPKDSIGLVGYFKPELPTRSEGTGSSADDAHSPALVSRFNQRNQEYDELASKMKSLADNGEFTVVDKVVHELNGQGVAARPVAGDHDIYDLVRLDGRPLEEGDYLGEIEHLVGQDAGVTHGAHRYWEPVTDFDKQISEKIIASHAPGGEPLVAYGPRPQRADIFDWDTGRSIPHDEAPELESELPELVHPEPDHERMEPGPAPFGRPRESTDVGTPPHAPAVSTETSGGRGQAADVHPAPEPDTGRPLAERGSPAVGGGPRHTGAAPRSTRSNPDVRPDERGTGANGHGAVQQHRGNGAPRGAHPEVPVPSDRAVPSGPSRSARWADTTAEIQQDFTDRYDYTAKTESVAKEAEEHFQEALTDRGILRSRLGLGRDDLSQSGLDKVLSAFKEAVKSAFDERFGTVGDHYRTGIDHVSDFHDQLDSLARELPARLDREALWEQQSASMRARFDEAFNADPTVAARMELFGSRGTDRIEAQRSAAWQRLEPELRNVFDDTAGRTSTTDLASAVSERFDDLMRDEVPKGIGLHDRLQVEVSAGRAAVGDERSPSNAKVEQRITSEFESVFGKPFAARPDGGWPHQDDFSANDRWEALKHTQLTDWLPKEVALDKELGAAFTDRFDAGLATRAEPRAELGLSLQRPTGSGKHGLTYDSAVGRPSTESRADAPDEHEDSDVGNPSAAPARDTNAWLPGRDLSDAGLKRARSALAGELSAAFRDHFKDSTADADRDDAWQSRRDDLVAERLPKLLEYEAAYERQLSNVGRDFDDAFDDWEDDFAGGGHLDDDALERVRTKFDEDLRNAYDQVHQAAADRWDEAGGTEQAWQKVAQRLLGGTRQRFESEEALVTEMGRAAGRYDQVDQAFDIDDAHRQDLGSAYRTVTATKHEEVFGDGTRNVADWLTHDKANGDAFGSRLTQIKDQRAAQAARVEAERVEAERAAAEAARAAAGGTGHDGEDGGQPVPEVREELPPETGAEKLQRLTAENTAKAEDNVQQLAQVWRDAGHGDAVVEQATKAWTDTVNREFDSFHHGLADNDRLLTGGRWADKYDNLVDIGKSDQWIGAHKQVGDAMAVLDDGLRQREAEWSGSRYADWQRDQLAGAGRQLASELRSELSKQLRYLQVRPVDAVAEETRRQWTADAVTKGFDGVLDRLRQDVDTSPVLLASLAKLRTDTVAALDAPGHAWHPDEEPVPDLSGASAAEQLQHVRTQLDPKYAEQLKVLATLEGKRPDVDAIFSKIVDDGRDESHGGVDGYEQMLPDFTEFKQAFDQSYDQAFAPLLRARPGSRDTDTSAAEQRWNDRRRQLENTLTSRVRLAAKHTELDKQAADIAQATRERWISDQAADEKIVDQTLDGFRENQKRLFLGTYGRLDPNGRIDVSAPATYEDAHRSLVTNLDKQLAAAVKQDTAEKAASAQYDEAVNSWRESHGPALSSFEPDLTVAVRSRQSPELEFAPDPEAQFEASFAAEAASASARHLDQLRREMIDANRSAEAHQASYADTERARGASAALKTKLDLEGRFVEAMPKLQDGIAAVVRGTDGLDERAAQSLVKSAIARADAAFQRIARRAADSADAGRMLQRDLDDVIAGTKAVAEFEAAVAQHVQDFAESSAEQLPAQADAHVVQWAHDAAAAKFDQLIASGQRSGETRITALSQRLDEALSEVDGRLEFEVGAQKAISAASAKAAQVAEEELRATRTVLDPDSVQRLQFQHITAAQEAAGKVREDLAAHHFDPEYARQGIDELDDALQHLVDDVQKQMLVESKLTAALTHAGDGFAALTDAHMEVPVRAFAEASQDYRNEFMTTLIRTTSDKPLDAPSWLEHESKTADRFNTALHAPVREVDDWSPEVEDLWQKSSFSPVGADAACVEVVPVVLRRRRTRGATRRPVSPRSARDSIPRSGPPSSLRPRGSAASAGPVRSRAALSAYPVSCDAVAEWITCAMSGILETVEVVFVNGADVPVKHKYADRMVVMRGEGGVDAPGLYYTADEWQAFILGVKEGEFDDMASGAQVSDGARRVMALRDSKDPNGTKLILAVEAWSELLVSIKAGERELPTDMRDLLDERFH
jgi:hypothetical protein